MIFFQYTPQEIPSKAMSGFLFFLLHEESPTKRSLRMKMDCLPCRQDRPA